MPSVTERTAYKTAKEAAKAVWEVCEEYGLNMATVEWMVDTHGHRATSWCEQEDVLVIPRRGVHHEKRKVRSFDGESTIPITKE